MVTPLLLPTRTGVPRSVRGVLRWLMPASRSSPGVAEALLDRSVSAAPAARPRRPAGDLGASGDRGRLPAADLTAVVVPAEPPGAPARRPLLRVGDRRPDGATADLAVMPEAEAADEARAGEAAADKGGEEPVNGLAARGGGAAETILGDAMERELRD